MANRGPKPQAVREQISATMRAKSWLSLFTPIRRAADEGNRKLAHKLLTEYMDGKRDEAA